MDLHWANEKTHMPMFDHFRAAKKLVQSFMFVKPLCIAWPQTNRDPAFCIAERSLSEFILWFRCSVRELISKPKKSKLIILLITRPPTRNHTGKMSVSYTSWYKSGETTACTASVQFLFRSLVGSFFSLDTTFRWSALVNLPETDHSTSLSA